MKGELILLPNLLNKEADHKDFLPRAVDASVARLDGLIAENAKEGRAFLKRFTFHRERTFRDIPITLFNKHNQEIDELLAPMRKGEVWGLISDAGLPILADPGYELVRRARDFAITVHAHPGPSSLILALMLSGLPSQQFSFHGYLPKNGGEKLKELEDRGGTHLFIEAPFRNKRMLETLLGSLADETLLCLATDLTLPTQSVETHPVAAWKKRSLPKIDKRPTIFAISPAK